VAVRNVHPIVRIGVPLLLAVVVFSGFYIVLERLAPPKGWARADYIAHAGFAWHWRQGHGLLTPHFLFQALIIVCHTLSPVNTVISPAIMAGGLCAVAGALATYAFWIRQLPADNARDYWFAALWSLGLQIAGPITLATVWVNNFYWGYIYPASTYHNPTIVLLKPLAIMSFALTLQALERSITARPGWHLVLGLSAAGMVSALAKPNWLLCFLPGLVLTMLFDSGLRRRPWAWCAAGAAFLSGLSVLAWQYVFLYGHQPDANHIVFTPQKWLFTYGWLAPLKLMLSIAFPVSVLVLFWNDLRKSLLLGLAWSTFDMSLLIAYGFSETGWRAGDDNLGWSAQIALFVLFMASAIAMVGVLRQPAAAPRWRGLRLRKGIAVAIFMLHVAGGLTWNATYVINRGIDTFWY
jgi:hypothetical protein